MATRNEVIYQSVALYSSAVTGAADYPGVTKAEVSELQRVQDISWGGEVTRTEINCMGKLASLSREIIEEPTVNLSFSYYLANAFNESGCLGMNVQGMSDAPTNLIANILADDDGANERNYYVATVPQGYDADDYPGAGLDLTTKGEVGFVGIGNAFMSEYSVSLAVGDIPTASVQFDAANLTFATGNSYLQDAVWGIQNPAIDRNGTLPDVQFEGAVTLPAYDSDPGDSTENLTVTALRPGDITLSFGTTGLAAGGVVLDGNSDAISAGGTRQQAHIQSVTITVPMSRTPLNTLGNPFAFARKLDVPINTTLAVSANVGDLVTGSLVDLVCTDDPGRDITITLGSKCGGISNMIYEIKGAQLDSQNMSIGMGESETVELQFTAQVGGKNDQVNGVFLSGSLPL